MPATIDGFIFLGWLTSESIFRRSATASHAFMLVLSSGCTMNLQKASSGAGLPVKSRVQTESLGDTSAESVRTLRDRHELF